MTRTVWIITGLGGGAATFLCVDRFVLHHFVTGPFLWDSGWYAYAIFQAGFLLPNPPFLRHLLGDSLFTQHLYGLMSLLSPLSYAFRTHYQYFAAAVGATFALAFAGPFLAVRALAEAGRRTAGLAIVALLAGLAFVLSGPLVSAVGYPHFEIAIPGFFLVFLALHFLGWPRARWVALILGTLVREDAGLHYAAFCAVILAYQWRSQRRPIPQSTLVRALLVCVGISVVMLAIQRLGFPLGASMFDKSFVGNPPFAHVNAAEIGRRARAFLSSGSYLYGPMIVGLLAALWWRTPVYLLGYVACVPWIVLNVVFSLTPAAQTLSLYYGFPLAVGLAWPLLAPHWLPAGASARTRRQAVLTFFIGAAASVALLGGQAYRSVSAGVRSGDSLPAAIYLRQSECLASAFRATPALFADSAVVAMFPGTVPSRRVLVTKADVATVDASAFVFYDDAMAQTYRDRAAALALGYETALIRPAIRVLSRAPSVFAGCLGVGIEGK